MSRFVGLKIGPLSESSPPANAIAIKLQPEEHQLHFGTSVSVSSLEQNAAAKQARNGVQLLTISGIAWIILSNCGLIYSAASVSAITYELQSSHSRSRFDSHGRVADIDSMMPSGFVIWIVGTLGQLVIFGAFCGLAMVILGYARLFLAKQAVFQQHIAEQLHIQAGGNVNTTRLAEGATHVGDQFNTGDITGGAVGRGARVNARDISAFKQVIDNSTKFDDDLKSKLVSAREAIETMDASDDDKQDVAESLGKITEELEKPTPEPGRLERFFNRVKEVAPVVASILASAAQMRIILGLGK